MRQSIAKSLKTSQSITTTLKTFQVMKTIFLPENDDDFSQNDDYNPSTQKMADGPEPFQPFDGEYGPYFANFTEQMLFLWVTKHMICK